MPSEPEPKSAARSPGKPQEFRWHGFFQQTPEPIFFLDRRRRILFVNRAWETLTGLSLAEVRGHICKRRSESAEILETVLGVLAPPPETIAGAFSKIRRRVFLPHTGPAWWEVSFFPMQTSPEKGVGKKPQGILAKIQVLSRENLAVNLPLPESLVNLREGLVEEDRLLLLAGDCPGWQRVQDQVRLASQTLSPVVLLGPPGSGKRWLARAIHRQSPKGDAQFFAALDCSRLPAGALVDLVFSKVKKSGLPLGTLYLREPGHLPTEFQSRLCEQFFRDVDGPDFPRLMAGFCTDPQEQVKNGSLLPQLYSRLATLVIQVPSLQERKADLPQLVSQLMPQIRRAADRSKVAVSPATLEILQSHSWPENLRELVHVLIGAAQRAKSDSIEPGDLPLYLRSTPETPERTFPLDSLLEQVEKRLITLALRLAKNNKTRAAELLAIWRPRLLRRLEYFGIQNNQEDSDEKRDGMET